MSQAPISWVTGARGYIGQRLARYCAQQGHEVSGVGHGAWPATDASRRGVRHWINGDVSGSNLRALCEASGRPTTIFHLAGGSSVGAAISNPGEDYARTVGSTASLLEWLRQESPQTRLVAASSAAVYGAGHAGRIAESAPLRPNSPYGFHKLMMENLCHSYAANYGLPVVVARCFSVYGDGLRKQLLWDLCCKLAAGAPVIELGGDGEEQRDWLDVEDAVRMLEALSHLASPGVTILNVGTGVGTSVREVAQAVLQAWRGADGPARTLRFSGVARSGDPRSLIADPGLLAARGISADTHISQGAARYVRWFRATDPSAS